MAIADGKSMPTIFVDHGNPMNIIRPNRWAEGWKALGCYTTTKCNPGNFNKPLALFT